MPRRPEPAADDLHKLLKACEKEANKPRPAPPPQQYIRGIPVGHAPAGMPPDPCADLRKQYDEAKKALEDAVDPARDLDKPPIYETEEDEEWWKDVPDDVWWKKKPPVGSGEVLGMEQMRKSIQNFLDGCSPEEFENARRNAAAQFAKEEGEAKEPDALNRVRARRKLWNEEYDRASKRRSP